VRLASFSTLLLALLLAGPALWHGFVTRDLEYTTALIRLLIAVPVAGIMIMILRGLTGGYRSTKGRSTIRATAITGQPIPRRRTTDSGEESD
jgi:hypothetical protein